MGRTSKKILERDTAYKQVFNSEFGDRVLDDLIERYNVMEPITARDPVEMAHREGQRSVVLHILKVLVQDSTRIRKAMEHAEKEYNKQWEF
jgi:hypothetical protein